MILINVTLLLGKSTEMKDAFIPRIILFVYILNIKKISFFACKNRGSGVWNRDENLEKKFFLQTCKSFELYTHDSAQTSPRHK